MRRNLLMMAVMTAMALSANAAKFAFIEGSTDWADSNSYTNEYGEAMTPQPGIDEIVIPANTTAVLRYSDIESWAFANSIGVIRPLAPTSYLVIYVDGTDEATFYPAVNFDGSGSYAAWMKGGIVKRGTGTVTLGAGSGHWDYFTDITVKEGTLKLPQNVERWSWRYYDVITVEKGATLYVCDASLQGSALFAPLGLEGEGTVTSAECSGCNWIEIQGGGRIWSHEFAGKLSGKIKILNAQTYFNLTGTENDFRGGTYGNIAAIRDGTKYSPVIGLMKIGRTTDAASSAGAYDSSHGLGFRDDRNWNRDTGGTGYLYLGAGETTDKKIRVYSTTTAPDFFDAGANGGITFTGALEMGAKEQQRFIIKGSNTQECVVAGPISRNTDWDASPYKYYNWRIIKQGTGAWHFTDVANNQMAGVFAVEDGTLRFDSLAEAGTLCSLGLANQLYDDYSGALDPAHVVTHAFELGREFDDDAAPVFEYTGVGGTAWCYTRPIALKGNATIRNSGSGELRLSGVAPLLGATEPKTLTLDGVGTRGYLLNVDDSDANLSIVKKGTGTWTLGGTNNVAGAVRVLGGKLVVQNVGTPYTWFRWIHKKTFSGWQTSMYEFGLFASDGSRQNSGLEYNANFAYARDQVKGVQPGQFAYGAKMTTLQYTSDNVNIFDNNGTTRWDFAFYNPDDYNTWHQAAADDPTSWFKLVMRLPENSKEVTSFDMLDRTDYYRVNASKIFALEGSPDGLAWSPIFDYTDERDNIPQVGGKSMVWRFGGEYYSDDNPPSLSDFNSHTTGKPIVAKTGAAFHGPTAPLSTASELAIGNGATFEVVGDQLQLKSGVKFTLCGSAGGTIRNVAFPANGTLAFELLPGASMISIPVVKENVTGYANVANWPVLVNGTSASERGYSVMFSGDSIIVKKPRLCLMLR